MKRFSLLCSCGVAAAIMGTPAAAQPFAIDWHTTDGGGGTSTGGSFELSGTIGQHDAGGPMTGGNFSITGGFWPGAGATPGGRLCADQNSDGSVDPTDFTAWIANFNAGDLKADVNQNGSVEPSDFNAWIAAFNQGASGPICSP